MFNNTATSTEIHKKKTENTPPNAQTIQHLITESKTKVADGQLTYAVAAVIVVVVDIFCFFFFLWYAEIFPN